MDSADEIPLDLSPVSFLRPDEDPTKRGLNFNGLIDGDQNEDVLDQVMRKIKLFSKFLGLSYEGFEKETMALFIAIEQKRKKKGSLFTPTKEFN